MVYVLLVSGVLVPNGVLLRQAFLHVYSVTKKDIPGRKFAESVLP